MGQGEKDDEGNDGVPETEDGFMIPWLEKVEKRSVLDRLWDRRRG